VLVLREFVSARHTPEAYSLGLALALPERVQAALQWVLARPTGSERAVQTLRIEGVRELVEALRAA
jgi:hypothetical protein